jgi:hypothetical protein
MGAGQIRSIQQRLLGNTNTVQQILQLQSDPDMQAVLPDTEVIRFDSAHRFSGVSNTPQNPETDEQPKGPVHQRRCQLGLC